MSRIIIISELFYPDTTSTAYVMTRIADKLSESHDVEVICGDSCYDEGNTASDIHEKRYTIHRIKSGHQDKNKIATRIVRFISSSFKLAKKLYSISNKDDKVLLVTNPAPFLILGSLIKRIKSFDLTIVVQDVFPENAVAAGIIKSDKNWGFRLLKSIFNQAYSSADRLIVIGRDMADLFSKKLSHKAPPMLLIENWADPVEHLSTGAQSGPIKILFAGNIGRCQGLESFTNIFGKIKNPNVRFNLRGGGAVVPTLKKIIQDNGITNIEIGEKFTRDEQFDILNECDIALVTLCDGMYGLGVPSKSYNIMSAGKPILFIGDPMSEIALVIKEYKIGYVFANSDVKGLSDWLNNLSDDIRAEFKQMGARAKELALTIFSEDTILSKYSDLYNKI